MFKHVMKTIKQLIVHYYHRLVHGRYFNLSFDSQYLIPLSILDTRYSDEAEYYFGQFEKKGRVKLNHTLVITDVDIVCDEAKGYILYCDTNEKSSTIVFPLCLIDAFFKKKKTN